MFQNCDILKISQLLIPSINIKQKRIFNNSTAERLITACLEYVTRHHIQYFEKLETALRTTPGSSQV